MIAFFFINSISTCFRLETTSGGGTELPEKHAMSRLAPDALQHLDSEDLTYFSHWTLCLDLEEEEGRQPELRQIWTKSSRER